MKESGPPSTAHWLGQTGLAWNILLVVDLPEVPDVPTLVERLTTMSDSYGWAAPTAGAVVTGSVDDLLESFAVVPDTGQPVSVGVTPSGLVIRAHHAYVDGLGLLALVRDLTDTAVRSRVAGALARPTSSVVRSLLDRLVEVALRPPAPIAGSTAAGSSGSGEAFATARVDGPRRTSDLAAAAVAAVGAWNERAGVRHSRIALAVGVSTTGGEHLEVGDDSGFLRVTDAERLSLSELEQSLARAPLQFGGTAQSTGTRWASPLIRWGTRVLAPRLGSTVLVSHLGRVEASVTRAAFYPMAGGGSGLAVGAITVGDTTTLTLRARARQHSSEGLGRLLDDIVARLG